MQQFEKFQPATGGLIQGTIWKESKDVKIVWDIIKNSKVSDLQLTKKSLIRIVRSRHGTT
jgi:hypothetical protein